MADRESSSPPSTAPDPAEETSRDGRTGSTPLAPAPNGPGAYPDPYATYRDGAGTPITGGLTDTGSFTLDAGGLPGPRHAAAAPVPDGTSPPDPASGTDPATLAWAENDWAEALLRARRAGRAYVYLNLIEQRLRAVISAVLVPVYGPGEHPHDDGAWVLAAAGNAQNEWVERAEAVREMSRRRGYIVDPADDDLIAFLTLPQLRELMVRNWWCFEPFLSDRRTLERALEEVEIGRHIVARNRVLSPDVLAQVERACLRVLAILDGPLADQGDRRLALDAVEELFAGRYADVVGVFPDRSALQRRLPFADLVDGARGIDAMGVSLNLLCQNYSGRDLTRLGSSGCEMRLLFLNPAGEAMKQRERDEDVKKGLLARMTTLNILHMRRIRSKLREPRRIEIRLYDEAPRFAAYLVDGDVGLIQPYLRHARGVESPAFVLRADTAGTQARGLYPLFQEEFEQQWTDSKRTS
ncbi:SAV2148 family HEPN domain-containing protein [Streptomyces sp. SID3343]|uniref:SAV2148 family HEPN domain-containing protein n=1 Tax=Streptomyces sp. SID3343 TaxID=2690260 RepID=UPI001928FBC3|nr:SAV2148 family HEPN domain-containing protein [Streptomyces sp. SID3343]